MNYKQMKISEKASELKSNDDSPNGKAKNKCISVNYILRESPNLPKLDEKELDIPFNNKKMYEESVNYIFSVEKIFHLASQFENPPSDLKVFFSESPKTIAEVFEDAVNVNEIFKSDDFENMETWLEWLGDHQLYGWLVLVIIPDILFDDDGSICYTWDLFTYKWFYAETYERAISKAKKWIIDERNN